MEKTNNRKVSLISRESNTPTLDFQLLSEELKSRGIEVQMLCRLFRKELSLSALSYIGHIVKQKLAIKNSNVVVLDTYCIPASMSSHSKDTDIIQMWHALSAVKKFGWQTVGMKDGSNEKIAKAMKMHEGYDHVLCTSDVTAKYFCEAFKTTPDKIVKLGLPRIDYILKDDAEMVERIRNRYPLLKNGKQTILYAPTFHKGEAVDVKGLADALDYDKFNLIVKLHPIDKESSDPVARDGVIYDSEFDSYDMLRVADIVISDYSSLVVEASLTLKPLYLYVYDEEAYSKSTGLNMNFSEEAIGKYAFRNAVDLAKALEDEYDTDAIKAFRDKYIDINTDNCTKQLADYIELLLKK